MNAIGTGSLLMLDSIFLMNSIVIFFLLVSDKEKSYHPIVVGTVH